MAIGLSAAGGKRLPRTLLAVVAVAFAALAAGSAEKPTGDSSPQASQAAQAAQPGLSSFNLSGYTPFPQQRAYPGNRADNFVNDAADNGAADNFADSADILAATDSRLRGDGGIGGVLSAADLRKLLIHSANNNEGDAFDNLYRDAQLRLLSSLDDAFSVYATDAFAARPSIKSAEVRFQSALGGRRSQLGADIVGALREAEDESGKYGIGWQAHVYAAEEGNKGASGGFFYRRIQDDIQYGVNAFADYENHNYGDFFRYGFGGEVQNRHIKLAANYYIPVGGANRINSTLVAYSREGYDANIRIAIPGVRYFQAEAAYYRFDSIRAVYQSPVDTGFRYGGVLSPGMGIEAKLFYDGGGEELGGELSWRHTFGAPVRYSSNAGIIAADIFAPVQREHSQRIILATTAASPPRFQSFNNQPESIFAEVNGTITLATLFLLPEVYPYDTSVVISTSLPRADIIVSDTSPDYTVYFSPSAAELEGGITIFARGGTPVTMSAFATMMVSSYAPFSVAYAPEGIIVATAVGSATVGTYARSGGVLPYQYQSSHADVRFADGLLWFDRTAERTITAVLSINDSIDSRNPPVSTTLVVTALGGFVAEESLGFTIGVPGVLGSVVLAGGSVFNAPSGVSQNGDVVMLSMSVTGGRALPITVANDNGMTISYLVDVNAQNVDPLLAGIASGGVQGTALYFSSPGAFAEHFIAQITTSGGYLRPGSAYTYTRLVRNSQQTFFRVDGGTYVGLGNVSYRSNSTNANGVPLPVTATVIVDDDNEYTAPVSFFFTVTAVGPINVGVEGRVDALLEGSNQRVLRINASGGFGNITYTPTAPLNAAFTQNGRDFSINVPNIAASTRYVAAVRVDDQSPLSPAEIVNMTVDAYPSLSVGYTCPVSQCLWAPPSNVTFTIEISGGVGGSYTTTPYQIPGRHAAPVPGANNTVVFPHNLTNHQTYSLGYIINDDSSHPHTDLTPAATMTVTIFLAE